MTLFDVLARFAALGVGMRLRGDQLVVDAPWGEMTWAHQALLAAYKPLIVAIFTAQASIFDAPPAGLLALAEACGWPAMPLPPLTICPQNEAEWRAFVAREVPVNRAVAWRHLQQYRRVRHLPLRGPGTSLVTACCLPPHRAAALTPARDDAGNDPRPICPECTWTLQEARSRRHPPGSRTA